MIGPKRAVFSGENGIAPDGLLGAAVPPVSFVIDPGLHSAQAKPSVPAVRESVHVSDTSDDGTPPPTDPEVFSPLGTSHSLNAKAAAYLAETPGDTAPSASESVPGEDGDPTGQLWVAAGGSGVGNNPDGQSDFRIYRMDTDGLADDRIIMKSGGASGGGYQIVGLDTAANLFFAMDTQFHFTANNLTTGAQIGSAITLASTADGDILNQFIVDPKNHVIYAELFAYDYQTANPAPYSGVHGGDLIKFSYDPVTGAISFPYTFNDTSHTGSVNASNILINSGSTGNVYAAARSFWLSPDSSTLYYVDDNDNDPGGFWGFATNGIFKVSTSGSVGTGNAPTPVLLSVQSQFPVNDSNGYITGLTVNFAQGIIYFTTNSAQPGVNASQNGLWWMPIAGGTATKMTMPGGVTLNYPSFFAQQLAFDANARVLYLADTGATGGNVLNEHIIKLVLGADGKSFSSGINDFNNYDSAGSSDAAGLAALVFDNLPTLASVAGTSTQAVQGGSALTLLTGAPTITDPDNVHLRGISVTITNAQSGDLLFVNGQQSGTVDGGLVSVAWNASTHVLTLTGDVPLADYQTLFGQISYQDTGTDNSTGSHPTRSLTWIANDGVTIVHPSTSDPNEKTTTLVIDRAPTLAADSYAPLRGSSVSGTSGTGGTGVLGNDNDKDADAIALTAVNGSAGNLGNSTAGTYGHLTLNANGSFSYLADSTAAIDAAANGSHPVDSFTYTVSDGLGGVSTQTVSFSIDRPPTVAADAGASLAASSGTGNVLTNDSDKDGDTLTVSAVNGVGGNVGASVAGTYGHVTISANGAYTYLADNAAAIAAGATGAHLTDTFAYTANDAHLGTTSANLVVTLDRAPTTAADTGSVVRSATLTANAAAGVLANDSDRDADTLTVATVAGSAGNVGVAIAGTYGHLTLGANGGYAYVADITAAIDAAANGSHPVDTFAYTAGDGNGGTTGSTLTFTIDRFPTVVADAAAALESGVAAAGDVLTNDSDKDGDTLTVSAVAGSAGNVGTSFASTYGHLTLAADGGYSYLADNTAAIDAAATGAHLTDTIAYTASDGRGATTASSLVVTLNRAPTVAVNTASVAKGATATATSGTGVLGNDSDRDGDTLTVATVAGSAGNVGVAIAGIYGHLTLNANGSYSYVADITAAIDAAASGSHPIDAFAYTAGDGQGGTTAATLSFSIDRPAIAAPDAFVTNPETAIGAGLNVFNDNGSGTDRDPDGSGAFSVAGVTGGTVGTPFTLLPSGATLTVNSDGTFSYDPTNATLILSKHLAAPGTSASNTSYIDTFSYTLTDGGTATATVTVNGVNNANTIYEGDGGNNTITGDATLGGLYHLEQGGDDTVTGGSGNDGFYFGDAFTAADHVDGGAGTNDQIGLEGASYAGGLTLGPTTITGVEVIACVAGFSYSLTTVDENVATGETLTIWAVRLAASNTLTFDGSAEADGGKFVVYGGAGNDVLTGGNGDDRFFGLGGADTLTGNDGADTFVYIAAANSTGNADGTAYDTIVGFDASVDKFDLPGSVTGVDAPQSGDLSSASFDSDLGAVLGSGQAGELGAGHAVLFTATNGTLNTHLFLVVDADGTAGYQSGADYVFDITGATSLGSLGSAFV
ncbi:MAG: Ig-like domain-containing protein [Rhizomicrobium sp.]